VIGYYVHHQGHGHLHRATATARAVDHPLTGLSSRPRPDGWAGDWVELADDADPVATGDLTAHGWLHYVPADHRGLRERMAAISSWIAATAPAAMVVDVSVEVALLARLHGVPVVSVGMPGHRPDPAHRLGYGVSDLVVAPWPREATPLLHTGGDRERLVEVGAISRYAPQVEPVPVTAGTVLVLSGTGGGSSNALTGAAVHAAQAASAGWSWTLLSGGVRWVEDPWPALCAAHVVVSHCGQNAVAEIAAARRPAVLVPGDRPFDEQRSTARALRGMGLPVIVLDAWPAPAEWPQLLHRAAALDGADWARWNDGRGADRVAELLGSLAGSDLPGRQTA
jgi:hypothetical protein